MISASNLIVAIHQPNFFPWLGFFDKIAKADSFILLDNVQSPKNAGTWQNRVKLLISDEERWVTAPINRSYSGTREIREMHFRSESPWRKKIVKSLEASYKRNPYYDESMQLIEPLLINEEPNIAKYNIHLVMGIAKWLGLDTEKISLSSKYKTHSTSNELLCELTRHVGGQVYMYGGGAEGYQDQTVFEQHGIKLQGQNFVHPTYPQLGQDGFVAGLSVIDAAMNLGREGVQKLLNPDARC
jgi:hypothetical protein